MTDRTGRPLFAAAVQVRKSYVSYHLMPIYMNPALMATVSAALRKRMQEGVLQLQDHRAGERRSSQTLTKKALASFRIELPWAEKPGSRFDRGSVGLQQKAVDQT